MMGRRGLAIKRCAIGFALACSLWAFGGRAVQARTARLDSVALFDWDTVFDFRAQRLPLDTTIGRAAASTIRIMAVGDVMLGSDFPNASRLPPGDNPSALLRAADSLFRLGDVTFGNLEGSFSDGGTPRKQCKDPTRCYLFRMPTRYAGALRRSGFTHLSMANNHSADFGLAAQRVTMRLLDSLGIAYAGLQMAPISVTSVGGVRVGFCAFAPNFGAVPLNDYKTLRRIVSELATKCDIVIASCHMGAEGRQAERVTRRQEIFYGENRGNPYEIARVLIDAGADVVLGHGPHIPRALDCYKGRVIAYSLGNFCTYGGINVSGVNGYAPILELEVSHEGEFLRGKVHSFVQNRQSGLQQDESGRVLRYMREATRRDVPESKLRIGADGSLSVE